MKIWYLTRSLYPYQKGGGPLLRQGQIDFLRELGWKLEVITPNYHTKDFLIDAHTAQIPFKRKYIQKLTSILERTGIYEDYLDKWIDEAFKYLKDKIKKEDIVFATSGGELGMIKLGSLLQKEIGCKFVINYHDPLNYGYMNGLRRDKKFHIGREKAHEKYMANSDLILTSSQYYADVLAQRFTYLSDKIVNNYFGYIQKLEIDKYQKKSSTKINIAYVGTMGVTQSPELLYQSWKALDDDEIEIYFLGDVSNYTPLQSINEKGVHFIDFMPHDKFLEFMCEHIDIGFVSLVSDYFGACVPSKIYEYINLGLPMIGALPKGDGMDIINNRGYGLASNYNDVALLTKNIQKMKNKSYLEEIKKKILEERDEWSMQSRIVKVDKLLKEMK